MGRHTTVAAEMHRFGANGYVVDTPGLRDVGLWTLTPRDVAQSFPDIAQISRACRFDNCRHMEEPDCAVIAAVDCATLAASRLASYRQLLAEALG